MSVSVCNWESWERREKGGVDGGCGCGLGMYSFRFVLRAEGGNGEVGGFCRYICVAVLLSCGE